MTRPPHDFSLAHPKRLFLDRDEEGVPCHVLAGDRLVYGTPLLLQLADGTWLTGSYVWDAPLDAADPIAPARLRLQLADRLANSDTPPLTTDIALPADAVLRVHPSWKRAMNPRPPRPPRTRRTS